MFKKWTTLTLSHHHRSLGYPQKVCDDVELVQKPELTVHSYSQIQMVRDIVQRMQKKVFMAFPRVFVHSQ
jgi:hypothetical protein